MSIVLESGLVNTAYLVAYTTVLIVGSNGLETMAGIVRAKPSRSFPILTLS
jgi:hypothetical protein